MRSIPALAILLATILLHGSTAQSLIEKIAALERDVLNLSHQVMSAQSAQRFARRGIFQSAFEPHEGANDVQFEFETVIIGHPDEPTWSCGSVYEAGKKLGPLCHQGSLTESGPVIFREPDDRKVYICDQAEDTRGNKVRACYEAEQVAPGCLAAGTGSCQAHGPFQVTSEGSLSSCFYMPPTNGNRAPGKKSWQQAQEWCVGTGGDLASVHTITHSVLLQMVHWDADIPDNSGLWIGGSDKKKEGTWLWRDDSAVTSDGFTEWQRGEPNNDGNQDCLEWKLNGWDDDDCGERKHFVCSRPFQQSLEYPQCAPITWVAIQ